MCVYVFFFPSLSLFLSRISATAVPTRVAARLVSCRIASLAGWVDEEALDHTGVAEGARYRRSSVPVVASIA